MANSSKRCIDYANCLIELCGLTFPRISSIRDINSNFFVALFECITGQPVPDLFSSDDSTTEVDNIQSVINALSLDLLGLNLSHISGEDIVSGNVISIFNLLEVLEGVFLHLSPNDSENVIQAHESSSSVTVVSPENIFKDKSTSLSSSSTESEGNANRVRILKRKTCKMQKAHKDHHAPERQRHETSGPPHSKRISDTIDNVKSPLKRKHSKPISRTVKRPHTESIEELQESNFEKKVRILLLSDKSPVLHAQQMKKNYIRSLRSPLKRKAIPPCKKSFLLPYDLRPKTKKSLQQPLTKKQTFYRQKNAKASISENTQKDENIPAAIQNILKEFPGFKFPQNTLDLLTNRYYQHVNLMHKQLKSTLLKKPSTLTQTEKAIDDETRLSKVLVKDLQEKKHLRELQDHKIVENRIKSSLRDARIQSVKLKQYFEEFQTSMSRKLQKRNYSEELLVEKTFKQMLDLQKEKVHLLCKRVRETDELDAKQHRQYLLALKNLYEEQLDVFSGLIKTEQEDSSASQRAKNLATEKMYQEIKRTLQRDVRSLQRDVLEMIEDIHFRELDAQNFINSFQQQD